MPLSSGTINQYWRQYFMKRIGHHIEFVVAGCIGRILTSSCAVSDDDLSNMTTFPFQYYRQMACSVYHSPLTLWVSRCRARLYWSFWIMSHIQRNRIWNDLWCKWLWTRVETPYCIFSIVPAYEKVPLCASTSSATMVARFESTLYPGQVPRPL